MSVNSKRNQNVASREPITASEAADIANREIFIDKFNADYEQILKRTSSAPFGGLGFGKPPGIVGQN